LATTASISSELAVSFMTIIIDSSFHLHLEAYVLAV
jgi:hypothetical protein